MTDFQDSVPATTDDEFDRHIVRRVLLLMFLCVRGVIVARSVATVQKQTATVMCVIRGGKTDAILNGMV